MKDYLNREERNQIISLMALCQQIEGIRTMTGNHDKPIWDAWKERDFLTKDEGKNIKTAHTFLLKFVKSVVARLGKKEADTVYKQLEKFDFRIVDDFTLKKIFRDGADRMKNAVVPRNQFDTWCEEIMCCSCKNCEKHWSQCELYTVFEDNFVEDGGYNRENCKFSYEDVKRRDADAL